MLGYHSLASACLHGTARGLLLFKILQGASCSYISLISLDLFTVVYITRNAGLLVKFEGIGEVVEVSLLSGMEHVLFVLLDFGEISGSEML